MFCPVFGVLATLSFAEPVTKMWESTIPVPPHSVRSKAMPFFGKDIDPKKIEIDASTLTSDSDQVRSRLDRIGANYQKLSEILRDLEMRIEQDDRLREINETIDESSLEPIEVGSKRKSKWRPRKPAKPRSGSRRKSPGPNKPR